MIPALLAILGFAGALAAPPAAPVLYGGDAPDAVAEKEARAIAGAAEPARWYLEPIAPVIPGVYALGPAQLAPCAAEPVPADVFLAEAAGAQAALDEVLPDEASAAYERAAARLPCLAEPLPPAELAQFQFHRGIAALTRRTPDKDLGLRAFAAAISAQPDTAWNEAYAAFPRSVFFEGKVALLEAPRARVWLVAGEGTRLWLEGRELDRGVAGTEVLAGPHLAHVRHGDLTWAGVVDLPAGGEVVIGEGGRLWEVVVAPTESTEAPRAIAARRAVSAAFAQPVLVTRPGAYASLGADGSLGAWSDEGPYRTRLGVDVGAAWLLYERHIESPPVDVPNPSDAWALPHAALVVRFHPVLSARLGVGLAASGPFAVGSERLWRLMGSGNLGVAAEAPRGRVRPGAAVDLAVLLPGELTVAGEPTDVVLVGALASGTVATPVSDLVWIQAHVGGGWLGSASGSAGLTVQLRFPPP